MIIAPCPGDVAERDIQEVDTPALSSAVVRPSAPRPFAIHGRPRAIEYGDLRPGEGSVGVGRGTGREDAADFLRRAVKEYQGFPPPPAEKEDVDAPDL